MLPNPDTKAQTVVAVFDRHEQARRGVEELLREGFSAREISIIAPDPREPADYGNEVGVRVLQAGGTGLALGGLVGALTALLVPGVGAILAAGPITAAILGVLGLGPFGGFVGMLVGVGLPRHAAEEYERELKESRTLVFVHAGDRWGLAEAALWRARPIGIHRHPAVEPPSAEAPEAPPTVSHRALEDPTEHVEPAAPDRSLRPSDVAEAIEGQAVLGHTQWLDEADLRPIGGRKDL